MASYPSLGIDIRDVWTLVKTIALTTRMRVNGDVSLDIVYEPMDGAHNDR